MTAMHHLDAARALQCRYADAAGHPASPTLAAALRLLRGVSDVTAGTRSGDAPAALGSTHPAFCMTDHPHQPTEASPGTPARCPRCEINERMAAVVLGDLVEPVLARLGLQAEAGEARALVQTMLSPPATLALS